MSDDISKIFVDEDWKAQVQREREQLEQVAETEEQVESEEEVTPSFSLLVSLLATQALAALGLLVQQGVEQVYIDLDAAKFNIDLLQVMKEKTINNLTPEEDAELTRVLAELQQVYVARVQQYQQQSAMQQAQQADNIVRINP